MADTGKLTVNVYDGGIGKPIEGATVKIVDQGARTVHQTQSDSFGAVHTFGMSAPPKEYSLQQGPDRPYSEYLIEVLAEGYGKKTVEGVQVFSDVTAQQNVILQKDGGETRASVPPPVLWGAYPSKLPEEDTKPLPSSKNYVVLPDPVIPAQVIVHEGVPTDNTARNTWVSFPDYVKNVASSEIYATWPDAAIRANVLAIISFTLNRVYTEWYRGKGYNFTITNSTAYDQAFSRDRTIYKEIAVVVDEMFTTFITKEAIRQPLLTQYCDGRNVSCPGWMTQWGSKEQAERGMTAVDILKNAYGQDIFLMQANKVDGVPKSFPGTNLQTGSRGQSVRTIQEQLNGISGNYPAIKKQKVDGVYGPATREAVEVFQRAFGLPVTGIVDFGTWYKISDVYVAVTRMAELR